jgi:kinesin family protein 15
MEDSHIKVSCRVRPFNTKEINSNQIRRCVNIKKECESVLLESKPEQKIFSYDFVADENMSQSDIFANIGMPITKSCIEGYNGTVLCYGQTGSGKTFTMFGPDISSDDNTRECDKGLVPRVFDFLWDNTNDSNSTRTVVYKCSFYEIYQEKVFDLLDTTTSSSSTQANSLQVREDSKSGVYVEGCIEAVVQSPADAKRILALGYRNRHVGETAMNRESSRSHAVFQLVMEATTNVNDVITKRSSRFCMVDLAGSERQKDTHASGDRLKEASVINKSLSALGHVINALADNGSNPSASGLSNGANAARRHVHYRDSKLTFLLRDSLGGNSKVNKSQQISVCECN